MVFAMLIGSHNYGINLGFILTFLLAGIGVSALLQTWRNLVGLEISPGMVEPVFCGEIANFPILLHNNRVTTRPGVQLKPDKLPIKSSIEQSVATDLPNNQNILVNCPLRPERRGNFAPQRWTVFTYFPVELFYSWAYFHTQQKCMVYPKPIESDIPLNQLFKSNISNGIETEDNIDFFGHRKYVPGDNLNRLDWKALARGRGYLIKKFLKTEGDDIWLNWEDVNSEDKEEILSILCRGIIELSKLNTPFGLSIPGTRIEPGNNDIHRGECLTALALFEQ